MSKLKQAVRFGKTGTAKENNILQADCITIKFNLLNIFYALVAAYWLVLVWGLL
jgi:hypothetical protein